MKKTVSAAFFVFLTGFYSCKNAEVACIDQSKVNPDLMCMQVYEPVCGCDGKTYANSCEADKAGVTSYTKGSCQDAQ